MTTECTINDLVREKLRKLRLARGLTSKEFAFRLGIPRTSYVSLETGAYNFKVDLIHRALAVLRAEITDVWPQFGDSDRALENPAHLKKIQEFRLAELVSLANADGAAFLCTEESRTVVLISSGLGVRFLERLRLFLEDGARLRDGFWFETARRGQTFHLFIKAPHLPVQLRPLAGHYLTIWVSFFGGSTVLPEKPSVEDGRPAAARQLRLKLGD